MRRKPCPRQSRAGGVHLWSPAGTWERGWRHTWGLSADPSLGYGWASHLKAELSVGRQCEVGTG